MLSDTYSEGKLKDLQSPFPLDQSTELDNRDFLDDSDLEDVEDDTELPVEIPDATSEDPKSSSKNPMFSPGFTSALSPQIPRVGSMDDTSSTGAAQSMDPGTHLGNVVVLRDISFVT